jgi:hypothetical protein
MDDEKRKRFEQRVAIAAVKITAEGDSDYIAVFIDGILHVEFERAHYRGLVAFRAMVYTIRIYFADTAITLEYDKREHWVGVLDAIKPLL